MPAVAAPEEAIPIEIKPTSAAMTRVAAVIFSAIAISAVLCYLLTGAGTKLFSPHTTLTTLVPDAAGVFPGSEVRLSGIPIGNVTRVGVSGYSDALRIVRIEMKVDAQFLKNIPKDSKAVITEDNLLGGQFVSIEEGRDPLPIEENALLAGVPLQQAVDQADLIRSLQDKLRQTDELVTQLSTPATPMGAFVLGSKEYDEVLTRIAAFEKGLHASLSSDSSLGQALFSEKMYDEIAGQAAGVDKLLVSIQKGEGAAGRLFAGEEQYRDLLKQLRQLHRSLADINAGKTGLLHDDAAWKQLQTMLADTDRLIVAFQKNKSVNDRRLYDSLNQTLLSIKSQLADFGGDPKSYLRLDLRKKPAK